MTSIDSEVIFRKERNSSLKRRTTRVQEGCLRGAMYTEKKPGRNVGLYCFGDLTTMGPDFPPSVPSNQHSLLPADVNPLCVLEVGAEPS